MMGELERRARHSVAVVVRGHGGSVLSVLNAKHGGSVELPGGKVEPGESCADAARRAPQGEDPWWVGPVGWYFRDLVAIEPVPCKGAQGLWSLPADVDASVALAVSRALAFAPKPA